MLKYVTKVKHLFLGAILADIKYYFLENPLKLNFCDSGVWALAYIPSTDHKMVFNLVITQDENLPRPNPDNWSNDNRLVYVQKPNDPPPVVLYGRAVGTEESAFIYSEFGGEVGVTASTDLARQFLEQFTKKYQGHVGIRGAHDISKEMNTLRDIARNVHYADKGEVVPGKKYLERHGGNKQTAPYSNSAKPLNSGSPTTTDSKSAAEIDAYLFTKFGIKPRS